MRATFFIIPYDDFIVLLYFSNLYVATSMRMGPLLEVQWSMANLVASLTAKTSIPSTYNKKGVTSRAQRSRECIRNMVELIGSTST